RKQGYSRSSANGSTTRSPAYGARRRRWRRASARSVERHVLPSRARTGLNSSRRRERVPQMTAVDGGLLLLLLLFGLRGFWRGFLRAALGLAGVGLAGARVLAQ